MKYELANPHISILDEIASGMSPYECADLNNFNIKKLILFCLLNAEAIYNKRRLLKDKLLHGSNSAERNAIQALDYQISRYSNKLKRDEDLSVEELAIFSQLIVIRKKI